MNQYSTLNVKPVSKVAEMDPDMHSHILKWACECYENSNPTVPKIKDEIDIANHI